MEQAAIVRDLGLVLAASLVGAVASLFLRFPPIVGYIIAGVILGGVLGLVQAGGTVFLLAQIGIILLLFSLGIELSFGKLSRVLAVSVFGGTIQILGVILLGLIILPSLGFSYFASLVLAFGFSLSSTAVVVKILSDRGELDSLPGEIMAAWLIVQDLAVVPMVVILPALSGVSGGEGILILGQATLKSIFVVAATVGLGHFIVPRFMDWVANFNLREILLLATVSLVLGVAYGFSLLGISPPVGAFLAGLVIAPTFQSHAVFAEIRPLREIFVILFFVSLGALVDPAAIFQFGIALVGATVAIMLIKFILVFFLVLFFGYHGRTAFYSGVGLSQIGEFSFVLAVLGGELGILQANEVSFAIAVTLLSLILTPILFPLITPSWRRIRVFLSSFPYLERLIVGWDKSERDSGFDLDAHVVVCGFGRVGSWLGRALELSGIPFIVVESNSLVVKDLKQRGIPVIYGDPAESEVLDKALLGQARLLIVAIPDRWTQEEVIASAQTLNPKIKIISRAHREEDRLRLSTLGVDSVIQPEFEAALSIIHRILQGYGLDKEEVATRIRRIKAEHTMVLK